MVYVVVYGYQLVQVGGVDVFQMQQVFLDVFVVDGQDMVFVVWQYLVSVGNGVGIVVQCDVVDVGVVVDDFVYLGQLQQQLFLVLDCIVVLMVQVVIMLFGVVDYIGQVQ